MTKQTILVSSDQMGEKKKKISSQIQLFVPMCAFEEAAFPLHVAFHLMSTQKSNLLVAVLACIFTRSFTAIPGFIYTILNQSTLITIKKSLHLLPSMMAVHFDAIYICV